LCDEQFEETQKEATMRIGEGSTPGPLDAADSKVRNASPAPASAAKEGAASIRTESGDVVHSGQGKALLELAAELSAVSRKSRVEEIRDRLVTGDYDVTSVDVSRAIVEDILARGFRLSL
jgi:anti-sigma28 factor (negative regulator of flagellin synthesis)